MVVAVDVSRRSLGGAGVQLRELSRGRMAQEGVYVRKQRINGGGGINRRERNASPRAVPPVNVAITIGRRLRVHLTSIRSMVVVPVLLPLATWRHRPFRYSISGTAIRDAARNHCIHSNGHRRNALDSYRLANRLSSAVH